MPERIQLRRARGWRLPEGAVKVDRTTPWGNPFVVGQHGDRARCVELFRYLLGGFICLSTGDPKAQDAYMQHARAHIEELRGRDLACWCSLPKPGEPDICHAAVLIEAANKPRKP